MKANSLLDSYKIILLLLFCVSTCLAQPKAIDFKLVNELIKDGAVLVDVRTPEEFSAGNIDGAVLLPYQRILELPDIVTVQKDSPIVLYCASGKRAGIAKDALDEAGYSQVYNAGGYEELYKQLVQSGRDECLSHCCCGCCKK